MKILRIILILISILNLFNLRRRTKRSHGEVETLCAKQKSITACSNYPDKCAWVGQWCQAGTQKISSVTSSSVISTINPAPHKTNCTLRGIQKSQISR
jgi:hypothetical protein